MTVDASRRRRPSTLVWGGAAAACLIGVLLVWLGSDAAADRALFGSAGSVIVVVVSLVFTAVGIAVGLAATRPSAAIRWGIALPLAICAGGVAVLAFGAFFAPTEPGDVGLGVLLAVAVIGMYMVSTRVSRGGPA
jgi:hypothetical protein